VRPADTGAGVLNERANHWFPERPEDGMAGDMPGMPGWDGGDAGTGPPHRYRPRSFKVCNRGGHSLEVLLRVYAKCLDGGEEAANRTIAEAFVA
jgi:hypothetical protein